MRYLIILWLTCAALVSTSRAQFSEWKHSSSIWILTTPEGADLPESAAVKDFPVLVRLHRDFFAFLMLQRTVRTFASHTMANLSPSKLRNGMRTTERPASGSAFRKYSETADKRLRFTGVIQMLKANPEVRRSSTIRTGTSAFFISATKFVTSQEH
jgi:hypothetical protein